MSSPYISEIKYHGSSNADFIEVAVDAGTDVADLVLTVYHSDGTVRSTNSLDGLTPTTIAGKDVYVIDRSTSSTFRGIATHNGAALSDDSGVYSFVSFTNTVDPITATEGAADTLTSTEIGIAGSGDSLQSTDGGATYSVPDTPSPGSIPCLTRGAMIETADGLRRVEDLKVGELVQTHDSGFQPLRLVVRKYVPRGRMVDNPKLLPVRISAGSLGVGLPRTDMLVSRQHRIAVSSPITKRMFDASLVLVPAVRLIEIDGVFVDTSVDGVEYFHLLLDTHEIIFADGVPTETLFLGDGALNALPEASRGEIEMLFPELRRVDDEAPQAAALIPEVRRQKKLVTRHVANDKPILASYAETPR